VFTTDEGEGWQQLGEGLMPSSSKDAGVMLEGFQNMAEQSMHSVLGGTSMPDLKDALSAMYNPQSVELGSSKLPDVEFFDSSSAGTAAAAPSGAESAAMQAGPSTTGAWQPSPGGAESAGLLNGAPGTGGAESMGMNSAMQAPGTIETLQAPGMEQATAMANAPTAGVEGGSYFKAMDGGANLGDAASPLGNIGKAFTDIMSKMGDMLGSMMQGPMGLLGGLLNFFLTVFSEILSTLGTFLEETARAAASVAAEAWKKQMEAMS
jgi:hypothetical protein